MAAPPNTPGPSRTAYLFLFTALNEKRNKTLERHISNGRFYSQPLYSMVKDMQLLLQTKDPGRKLPQTINKEDLPKYFNALLQEVDAHTEHDFYGKIQLGLTKGKWLDLPAPLGEEIPPPSNAPATTESPSEKPPEAVTPPEENQAKVKAEKSRIFRGGFAAPKKIAPETTASTKAVDPLIKQNFVRNVRAGMANKPQITTILRQETPSPPPVGQPPKIRINLQGAKKAVTETMASPAKNVASSAIVQVIRHPNLKANFFSAAVGAVGGGLLGGSLPAAGVGAILGGLWGPEIANQIGSFATGGRGTSGNSDNGQSGRPSGVRSAIQNRARNLANSLTRQAARRVAMALGRVLIANAWWLLPLIGIILLLILAILMLLCILPFSSCDSEINGPADVRKQITIQKSAPQQVENGASIEYKITVSNKGKTSTSVVVSDDIPADTVYESGDNDPVQEGTGVKRITWDIKSLSANQSKTLTFKVKPQKENFWVVNQATGNVSINIKYGSSTGLLPSPLPAEIGNWAATRDSILEAVNKYPEVVAAYQKAGGLTGVPWEVLAGLHYVETGNDPRPMASLVSGREIGVREPDIPPSACAAGVSGPGTPIPMGGGCGFSNFEDSAIYSAKHILRDNGGNPPSTFEEAVTSLSRYNGGGNRNCGRGVPYNFCPRDFEGEDDPYAMNYFDQKHAQMYLIYCFDNTQCDPFRPFGRPGSMAVIRALLGK